MSNDILEGRSEQMRASTQERQRKLTDSNIERVWGRRAQFLRALQEKYGYTRAKAGEEIERRLKEFDQKHTKSA